MFNQGTQQQVATGQQSDQQSPTTTGKTLGHQIIEELRKSSTSSNDVTPEIQEMLNRPTKLTDQEKIDPKDYEFLKLIMNKVENKEIELYRPASLLNMKVYESLAAEEKAKADFDILNLLNKIREIRKLWLAGEHETYQIFNLIHALRLTKERLEELGGDVFII